MDFKVLASRLVLATVCFASGYAFANRKLKDEYEKRIEEEVKSIREVVGRRSKKDEEVTEVEESSSEKEQVIDLYEKTARTYNNYNDIPTKKDIVSEKEAGQEASLTAETQDRDMDGDAYQISDLQFSQENQHYDKITLYYYTVDDVLTGENEEIIDDRERLLGVYEIESDDPSEAFYRNERLMIDYEVILIYGSYKTLVMGDDEE